MPPEPTWFAGRELIGRFLRARVLTEPGRFRLIPVAANGQPALAAYQRGHDGGYRAHSICVLTTTAPHVARVTAFNDPGLFATFRLPHTVPAAEPAWPADGISLLEPSISYAVSMVLAVTPDRLSDPTPCRDWDLRKLLRHGCESLAAFGEGIETGRVGLGPAAHDGALAADPARAFRDRACQLLAVWTDPGYRQPVIDIAGCPLAASVMAATAALEVAVHGWDVSQACGQRQPIPRALAIDLLAIAPVLVPPAGRHPLFAAPVTVAATAGPSDQLTAFLGRSPR
jgi:uncharacterized protein (TIGR03086 family)